MQWGGSVADVACGGLGLTCLGIRYPTSVLGKGIGEVATTASFFPEIGAGARGSFCENPSDLVVRLRGFGLLPCLTSFVPTTNSLLLCPCFLGGGCVGVEVLGTTALRTGGWAVVPGNRPTAARATS